MWLLLAARLVAGICLITLGIICAVLPLLLSMRRGDAGRTLCIGIAATLTGLLLVHF